MALTSLNIKPPVLGSSSLSETHGPCVFCLCSPGSMRPSHVNWQKICRLDRYPHAQGGNMGKVAFGAYTRGGAKMGPCPLEQQQAPRTSRSGRKTKEWETGLTIRERSPRYGATLESGDVPPDCLGRRG